VLRHALKVHFIEVRINGLTDSPALGADQVEKARKEHLDIEGVHVNRKEEVELDPFGRLRQ
jgi:hypothetical protein